MATSNPTPTKSIWTGLQNKAGFSPIEGMHSSISVKKMDFPSQMRSAGSSGFTVLIILS